MKNENKNSKLYNIILISLGIISIVLLIVIIILNKKNDDNKEKIVTLDNLSNEIVLLKDKNDDIDKINKKIKEVNDKNNVVNKEIDSLTNSIKDYEYKISKYRK